MKREILSREGAAIRVETWELDENERPMLTISNKAAKAFQKDYDNRGKAPKSIFVAIGAGLVAVCGVLGYLLVKSPNKIDGTTKPRQVYAADLNGDGNEDYAIRCGTCQSSDENYILLSSPGGTYHRVLEEKAGSVVQGNLEKIMQQ